MASKGSPAVAALGRPGDPRPLTKNASKRKRLQLGVHCLASFVDHHRQERQFVVLKVRGTLPLVGGIFVNLLDVVELLGVAGSILLGHLFAKERHLGNHFE